MDGDGLWAEEEFSTAGRWRGREGEWMDGMTPSGDETANLKPTIACWRRMSYLSTIWTGGWREKEQPRDRKPTGENKSKRLREKKSGEEEEEENNELRPGEWRRLY
jgi:hypothetical protein